MLVSLPSSGNTTCTSGVGRCAQWLKSAILISENANHRFEVGQNLSNGNAPSHDHKASLQNDQFHDAQSFDLVLMWKVISGALLCANLTSVCSEPTQELICGSLSLRLLGLLYDAHVQLWIEFPSLSSYKWRLLVPWSLFKNLFSELCGKLLRSNSENCSWSSENWHRMRLCSLWDRRGFNTLVGLKKHETVDRLSGHVDVSLQ